MSVPEKVLMRKIKKREKNKLKILKQRESEKQNEDETVTDELKNSATDSDQQASSGIKRHCIDGGPPKKKKRKKTLKDEEKEIEAETAETAENSCNEDSETDGDQNSISGEY